MNISIVFYFVCLNCGLILNICTPIKFSIKFSKIFAWNIQLKDVNAKLYYYKTLDKANKIATFTE